MLNEVIQEVKIQSALRLIACCKLSDEEIAKVTELKAQASPVTA